MLHTQLLHFSDYQAADIVAFTKQLSQEEQQRAERFVRDDDRRSYIISHFELRRLLAQELGCAVDEIVFNTNDHGKPALKNFSGLHFNLSHSGDCAFIALCDQEIGVDIEHHSDKSDLLAIAKRFFTEDEYLYVCNQEDRLVSFYTIWTLKEAYVKALGRGIAYGLNNFTVVSAGLSIVESVDGWCLRQFDVVANYSAAIAYPF